LQSFHMSTSAVPWSSPRRFFELTENASIANLLPHSFADRIELHIGKFIMLNG
jgi:hypothetical protein